MHNRKQKHDEEFSFWQPASDMFSALLLILMLVIILLCLYLAQIPEHSLLDPFAGNTFAMSDRDEGDAEVEPSETPEPTPEPTPTPSPTPTPFVFSGGGGGGDGENEGEEEGQEEMTGEEDGNKSAVYVMLVDAETERVIREAEVAFELYGEDHVLQVLNVYYPESISFNMYETTEDGTFFLPEKLAFGDYELKELTEPSGYDGLDRILFTLDEIHDWSNPYVIQIPLQPSQNVIHVQMVDAATGYGLGGGSFDIIANESIMTADGTLRYRYGETVGRIVCDEFGVGESEELYLGAYRLREATIPEYYAGQERDIAVQVAKRSAVEEPSLIESERTTLTLRLTDELNPALGIGGATFSITPERRGNQTLELVTDSTGRIILDELQKGTTYTIIQTGASGDYKLSSDYQSFTVGADGRIDGESTANLSFVNHIIRVSIGVTERFSSVQVSDVNIALFDASDNSLVRSWTSTGTPVTFTNLDGGNYYVVISGENERRYEITVLDQAQPQEINIQITGATHYIIVGAVSLAAILVLVFVILGVRRVRKKRRPPETGGNA